MVKVTVCKFRKRSTSQKIVKCIGQEFLGNNVVRNKFLLTVMLILGVISVVSFDNKDSD